MEEKRTLDINEIAKRIPHRYPFLLIDRVLDFEYGEDPESFVGRKIKARKNVTYNEPFFNGHFPENPIMPGVLQIEAMAQAGGLACVFERETNTNVLIAKVSGAKFRKQVIPGDVLDIYAEILAAKRSILTVDCRIECDGKPVSETQLMAKLLDEGESK